MAGHNAPYPTQGCSTLLIDDEREQVVDACESGTASVLAERSGPVCLEDVEGEAAQSGEHARVGADTRAVLAEGDVAAVVGGILDRPVRADGLGGAGGGERDARDVEGDLGGVAQQSGRGVAGVDGALDPDDGGDVRLPVGLGQPVGGIEDGDGAAFVAGAAFVMAAGRPERCRGGRDQLALPVQGGLVAFDLDDQGDVGRCCGLKCFLGSAARPA